MKSEGEINQEWKDGGKEKGKKERGDGSKKKEGGAKASGGKRREGEDMDWW